MRVAIVAPNWFPRTCGVGDHAMRVAQELVRRGAEVRVFSRAPVEPHEEAPEVPAEALGTRGRTRLTVAAYRAIRAFAPDTVLLEYVPHMFGSFHTGSVALPALARALRARGHRVVTLAHELYTEWHPRPDRAWQAASFRAQLALMIAASDRLFVTTEARLADARRLARADPARVGLVPIGPNAEPRPRVRPAGGPFRMGLFTSLDRGKRIDIALDAFDAVKRRVPSAELVLLGDWGEGADELRRAIDAHPFRGSIQTVGRLPLSSVAERIGDLDVFLFTRDTGASTRSGVLPVPLGSGVPVVAVRGADTGALFVADENVVFSATYDGAGFAAATLRLVEDPALAARVAKGGLALFRAALRWPAIVDALLGSAAASDADERHGPEEHLRGA